jgi:hypothetical protein
MPLKWKFVGDRRLEQIQGPTLENPTLENPSLENPSLENPSLENLLGRDPRSESVIPSKK